MLATGGLPHTAQEAARVAPVLSPFLQLPWPLAHHCLAGGAAGERDLVSASLQQPQPGSGTPQGPGLLWGERPPYPTPPRLAVAHSWLEGRDGADLGQ